MAGAREFVIDGLAIRAATTDDAAAVATIYAHHVRASTATFDIEPPTDKAWAARITNIIRCRWPVLVATRDKTVVGYAYVTQFRDRPAYAHTCENSIYVDASAMREGIGNALMTAILKSAAQAGFREMIAVISDETASVPIHYKHGFRVVGRMEKVGMKFGRLLDTVYMQRSLEHQTAAL